LKVTGDQYFVGFGEGGNQPLNTSYSSASKTREALKFHQRVEAVLADNERWSSALEG